MQAAHGLIIVISREDDVKDVFRNQLSWLDVNTLVIKL